MDLADAIHQARELQDKDRFEDALQLLLRASEEHEDEDLWFEIATLYFERGLRRPEGPDADDQAWADFDEADKWVDLPGTKAGRASILIRRKDFEKAEALVAEALDLDPDLAWSHGVLGRLRLRQGRFGEATESLAKAVELHPGYAAAWVLLGEALAAAGRKDFALKALTDGVKRCPVDDTLLVALAGMYREADDLDRAARALQQATTLNRFNASAWRGLAWIAVKRGDELAARQSIDKAIELDRDATLAWIAKESLTLPELNALGQ